MYSPKYSSLLSDNDKACAVNLAFLLELSDYNIIAKKIVSENLKEVEKGAIYNFWINLSPMTAKAALCMMEFENLL